MNAIDHILSALEDQTIARRVGIPHDEARAHYRLDRNTVDSFDEFVAVIADYFQYHFSRCTARGARMSASEARSRAKEVIEREYRRRNGDIVSAFNDAHDGTNGGLRIVCDAIAESLKTEAVQNYTRDIFDTYVTPNSWEEKVMIIRQFIERCGRQLSSAIRTDQPERYARDYQDLIRAFVDGLRQTSSLFRRL